MTSRGAPTARRPRRRLPAALALALAVLAAFAATAQAQTAATSTVPQATALPPLPALNGPATPPPAEPPARPSDFAIDGRQAVRIADTDPNVQAARAEHGQLTSSLEIEPGQWQVGFFADGRKVVLVAVDGVTGKIVDSWTGSAVDWPMARGRTGQFGHILNAPYVWIPMALVFFFALLRLARGHAASPTWTCSCCSRSGSPTSSSTRPRSVSRCRCTTRPSCTCSAACSGSASAAQRRPCAPRSRSVGP